MKRSIIITSIVATIFAAGTLAGAALHESRPQDMQVPKPGPEHAVLKRFEGDWDAVTSGMGESTKGKQTAKLACGGMWLFSTYIGEYMAQSFEGRGLMGFDQEGKKYQHVWVDPMTSKITVDVGTWDETTKTLTFDSKGHDGSPMKMLLNFPDADHYTLRFVGKDQDGKEGELFNISYTRRGAKAAPK